MGVTSLRSQIQQTTIGYPFLTVVVFGSTNTSECPRDVDLWIDGVEGDALSFIAHLNHELRDARLDATTPLGRHASELELAKRFPSCNRATVPDALAYEASAGDAITGSAPTRPYVSVETVDRTYGLLALLCAQDLASTAVRHPERSDQLLARSGRLIEKAARALGRSGAETPSSWSAAFHQLADLHLAACDPPRVSSLSRRLPSSEGCR